MENNDRNILIKKVVDTLNTKLKREAASTLSVAFAPEKVKVFAPTGNLAVDYVIGKPGFPIGRITEISGTFSSGKSTIAANALGRSQKAGMVTILIDTEHSYDGTWPQKYGVDPELLILIEPEHVEEIFDHLRILLEILSKEDKYDVPMLTVVDSVSAISTSAELEQEDSTAGKVRGGHAKAISEGLRKLGNNIWDKKMALVFISQLKDNPGMMYGSGKHKLGGHAIDFHAGLLLQTKVLTRKKVNDVPISQTVRVTSTKNKFVPPFRSANFEINYISGTDDRLTVLDFMSEIGWIKKTGGWFVDENNNKFRKEGLIDTITPSRIAEVYDYLGITNPANIGNGNDLMYSLSQTIVEGEEVKE